MTTKKVSIYTDLLQKTGRSVLNLEDAGFSIVGTCGSGTHGKVLLAVDRKRGEGNRVAIKTFDVGAEGEENEKVLIRLGREIRALRRVGKHRHIVQLLDVLRTPLNAYLVLEYVSGVRNSHDLLEYIIRYAPMTEVFSRIVFRQLLNAVKQCHKCGVAHRDIKPENVVLSSTSPFDGTAAALRVVLLDFGLSECVNDTSELKPCGTPLYSAPEEFDDGARVSTRPADMWSLGVVLYVMVCGKLPYEAPTIHQLREKLLLDETLTYPSSLSSSCVDLLRGLLRKDVESRLDAQRAAVHEWLNDVLIDGHSIEGDVASWTEKIDRDVTSIDTDRQQRAVREGRHNHCRRKYVAPLSELSDSSLDGESSGGEIGLHPNSYWFSAPISSNRTTKSPVLSAEKTSFKDMPALSLFASASSSKETMPCTSRHHWMYVDDVVVEEEAEEEGDISPSIYVSHVQDENTTTPRNTTGFTAPSASSLSSLSTTEEEDEDVDDAGAWYCGG